MNAGKLLILLLFIMVLVWYTAIWTLVIPGVRAGTDLTDFTMETIQNGGDCLRKSQVDDRLLVRYVIKIYGTDNIIETRTVSDSPYIVHLGQFVDIPTLERGLFDMCEQESRSMVVPPLLGYGAKDSQTKQGNLVPGNSTLQYDVTLVKIFTKEESKTNKDAEEHERAEGGKESAGIEETNGPTMNPTEETPQSEEDAVKAKDKKIVENIMADAMNAVFPEKDSGGGLADMLGGMIGGGGGGGMAGLVGQLAGAMGKGGAGGDGGGMAGLVGQLAGAMGKGGAGGDGGGMAGLVGQLAGAMGKGGAGGDGAGMAGLVGKLAGAMGGGGAGGMEGLVGKLAGAMGKDGEGGIGGLMGQLAGAMGKDGEGGMDDLMGKLSGLMGEGAGGNGGLDGLLGLMGGDSGGASLGKIGDAISKMMKKKEERRNRRKTEL